MPEPILIEFRTDIDQIQNAVNSLEELGMVDKETAEQFRKSAALAAEHNKQMLALGKNADKVTIDLQDMVKELQKVPKKIVDDAANKSIKDLDKGIINVTDGASKLTSQLRNMKNELSLLESAGKSNTKQYINLARESGKLQDQIGDTSKRVQILASDSRHLDAALSLASGLAGGFAVAQGAAALFGSENEDLQKALLKVQAALALVNGLQAIAATVNKDSAASVIYLGSVQRAYTAYVGESTGALLLFKQVALGLGIGAIIAGVVLLVRYFNSLSKETSAVGEAMADANKSFFEQKIKLDALLGVARDTNRSLIDRKKAVQEINDISPEYLGNIKLETINTEATNKALRDYLDNIKAKAFAQAIETKLVEEYTRKIDAQKVLQDEANMSYLDYLKATVQGKSIHKSAIKDITDSTIAIKELTEALARLTPEAIAGGSEKGAEKIKEAFKFDKDLATDGVSLLLKPFLFTNEIVEPSVEVAKDYVQKIGDLLDMIKAKDDKDRQDSLDATIESWDKKLAIAQQAGDLLSQISQTHLNNELITLDAQLKNKQISQAQYDKKVAEAKNKAAKQEKALNLANAVINTAGAVVHALNQFPGVPATIPFGILAGALGAVQIGIIASQKLPQFASGTRKVTGGEPNKDSVHALLMPGEGVITAAVNKEYDPILTAIHNRKIPSDFLNNLANMQLPDFGGMLAMLGAGYGVSGEMDYDRLAKSFAKEIAKNPQAHVNIDRDGVNYFIENAGNKTKYLNGRYSS